MPTATWPNIQWTEEGLGETLVFFRKMSDFPDAIKPITNIWGTRMILYTFAGRQNYVPQPVSSRYQRTGTLGAGWKIVEESGQLFAIINPTTYAIYVVGDEQGRQAKHMTFWWKAIDKIAEAMPGFEGVLKEEVESWFLHTA